MLWHLNGTVATLRDGRLGGTVDLRHPRKGFHAIQYQSNSHSVALSAANVMGLDLPGTTETEELHECWIRGADLVATYAATVRRAAQPEVYWRSLVEPNADGLELIVSVHTGLLDDYPSTVVTSRLQAAEAWWLPSPDRPDLSRRLSVDAQCVARATEGAGLFVVRLPSAMSYVEMVYPSDFLCSEVHWQGDVIQISTSLFPDRIEKGVIRRARIRGWVAPLVDALALAGRQFQEFADSEPPLTT